MGIFCQPNGLRSTFCTRRRYETPCDSYFQCLLEFQEFGRRNPRDPGPTPQHRPGHVYCFQTAVLRTNRQISKEAEHVFYHTNRFVFIKHHYNLLKEFRHLPELFEKEGIKEFFERRGFPILATSQTARVFKHCSMEVSLGVRSNAPDSVPKEVRWNSRKENILRKGSWFMIAHEDLQQLCKIILEVQQCLYGTYRHTILVDVVNRVDQRRIRPKDGPIPLDANVQRLLEPFRRLHSIGKIIILGDVNGQYKSEIVASMMKGPPTAEVMINTACTTKAEGDEASHNGDFSSAVSAYEKAHSDIEAGHQPQFPLALVAKGKYAGRKISSAKEHLTFTLRLDMMMALLKLGEYRNASNWARMELLGSKGVISNAEFARMSYLSSQARRALGQSQLAFYELTEAVLRDPGNEAMAADLGNMTANVLVNSTAVLQWASSPRIQGVDRRGNTGQT